MLSGRGYLRFFKEIKNIYNFRRVSTDAAVNLEEKPLHIPVMKEEVLNCLNLKDGDTVLDMTFGAGGHTKYLLERYPNLKVVALDRDPVAYECAKELQSRFPNQITPLLGKFTDLITLLEKNNFSLQSFDGVICDLGASSMQMDTAERGFALSMCGPLDMRMDGDQNPDEITAADVVNFATEAELYKIFKTYGEEKQAKILARFVNQARMTYQKFRNTSDLADLVYLALRRPRLDKAGRKTHGATKVFQALRIFVNDELNQLNCGLIIANFILKMGGRLVVLSFHSLEDTLIKRHFQGHIFDNAPNAVAQVYNIADFNVEKEVNEFKMKPWQMVNKKVILPSKKEVSLNLRSRSAKLRAAIKIDNIRKP